MTAETCDCPHMSVFFYFIGMFYTKAAFTLCRDLIQEYKQAISRLWPPINRTHLSQIPSDRSQIPDLGLAFSGIWDLDSNGTTLWEVVFCMFSSHNQLNF